MTHEIFSVLCSGPGPEFPAPIKWTPIHNRRNRRTPCEAYQRALERSKADVLIYIHDDVAIHSPTWLDEVLDTFMRGDGCNIQPQAGTIVAVGLGGAISLGHPDLYKRSYRLQDMARGGYRSNQTDAEVHGLIETGRSSVAVLDAFFMAVRRDFLLSVGGWPTGYLTHHCLDLWLACEAARAGKETWMVGCSCTHHGGGSSVKAVYQEASWLQGGSAELDHQLPHRWLYDSYRDVLPISL
jgi:hypothetical protein